MKIKLTVTVISILLMAAIAVPVFMLNGCGENNTTLNGGTCGACSNSPAPAGATMTASALSSAPSITFGACFPVVTFQILDSGGQPMNDICVEIFTNGAIAKAPEGIPPTCDDAFALPLTSLITRTNKSGVVMVEFLVPPSTTGSVFFVEGVSCAISAIASTPPSH
jgi:hypothetical protein